ncbi:MAG: hypothetical protein ACR2QG_03145 [Gammaproteobacteria bacterium]
MNTELPEDVIAALQAGRKIEAIKLLRAQMGMDLKTSKEAVEAYAMTHPSGVPMAPQAESGIGRLILIAFLVGMAYSIYQALA